MNEVLRISIARVSFTIEKDAYDLLENYLTELKDYYKGGEIEVVDGIEERISELLLEQVGLNSIVKIQNVKNVIDTLGNPKDIEDFDLADNEKVNVKRRIYRDLEHKKIGGVCSGISAYFNIDVVWVRLIVLSVCLGIGGIIRMFSDPPFFIWAVLLYCILWIVIPAAKTVAQKCEMYGQAQTADQISKNKYVKSNANEFSNRKGSKASKNLGDFITSVIGVILIIASLAGLVIGGLFIFGINLFFGMSPLEMLDYLNLGVNNTIWIKILVSLVYFLPLIGILYGGICLLFKLKSPKWRPGLIIFLLWLVTIISLIVLSIYSFMPYSSTYSYVNKEVTVNTAKDTLLINTQDVYSAGEKNIFYDVTNRRLNLGYISQLKKGKEFIIYPEVRIIEDNNITVPKLFVNYNISNFSNKKESLDEIVTIKDSLITIKPYVYSKEKKFYGEIASIYIHVPSNKTVMLNTPFIHEFNPDRREYYFHRKKGPIFFLLN
jgi:Putative stress-responsive transcriptional regulator